MPFTESAPRNRSLAVSKLRFSSNLGEEGISAHVSGLLLRVARYSIVLVFAVDLAGELLDGDPQLLTRWYIYAAVYALTLWLSVRKMSAQPLVIAASGFLAGATISQWLFGTDVGAADSVTTVAVIALLGMVSAVLRPGPGNGTLMFFAVLTGTTAFATAALDGLAADDALVRTLVAAFVAILGSWTLRTMRVELETIIRSKDEFIASVSHELRTPLTGVVGFAQTLEDEHHHLAPEEISELVGYVASQSREVAYLVEDLLVAARADLGTLSVQPKPVLLCEEAKSIVDTGRIRSLAESKSVQLLGESPAAFADPLRCRQIIRNLISNALRYGGSDIRVTVGAHQGRAIIDVSDDGKGLTGAEADQVFEAYYRARQTDSQPGSVGLGLAVSRQLARLMDGDVTTFRHEDRTVFRLSLPSVGDANGAKDRPTSGSIAEPLEPAGGSLFKSDPGHISHKGRGR